MLGAFGLGGDGNADVEGSNLGVKAHPEASHHFVGGIDGCSPQILDVVEDDDLVLLVVSNQDKVVILV